MKKKQSHLTFITSEGTQRMIPRKRVHERLLCFRWLFIIFKRKDSKNDTKISPLHKAQKIDVCKALPNLVKHTREGLKKQKRHPFWRKKIHQG